LLNQPFVVVVSFRPDTVRLRTGQPDPWRDATSNVAEALPVEQVPIVHHTGAHRQQEAPMEIHHLTFTVKRRHPMFENTARRREALRRLAAAVGPSLALFALVDEHLHAVLLTGMLAPSRAAQATIKTLLPIAATPFQPTDIRPVEGRSHMQWLVGYVLTQLWHHKLPGHPALDDGSCFLDLAGARLIEGLRLRIGDALQRFNIFQAYAAVGLPLEELEPASRQTVREAGVARLVSATTAALCVDPELKGRSRLVVLARAAVARLAARADIASSEVGWALGVSRRTLQRLLRRPVSADVWLAIRMRLSLENRVAALPRQLPASDR